ncbi:4'-phosphopantetheinyl transferase superfamily protein [Streptomyces sp. ACA25]|uniref:4'-phosphopantetheinyl transferase family protein n=1 Tax=Streptomyces sp. ACA25 TaxID=3022596 RepID=UPI0023072BFB|nr:4'-phosphopantetheinyl transferase superfamily protein [Streptomyces sp. ACA25]MDB1089349.1 4'-phosphopantetheinyl transferase superfamily protein [Streptomyces sp. ACA25]
MPPVDAPVPLRSGLPARRWSVLREQLHRQGHLVGHGLAGDWGTGRPGSRRLITTTLGALLGLDPARIGLERDGCRRPYAVDRHTGVRLGVDMNLSHTADVLLLGVSRHGRIGVDVERADRDIASTPAMLTRICHPSEEAVLAGLPQPLLTDAIARLWVCKEAAAKADGRGLALDFRRLRVAGLPPRWSVGTARLANSGRPGYWSAAVLVPPPDHEEYHP